MEDSLSKPTVKFVDQYGFHVDFDPSDLIPLHSNYVNTLDDADYREIPEGTALSDLASNPGYDYGEELSLQDVL